MARKSSTFAHPAQAMLNLGDLSTGWQPPTELPDDLVGPQAWDLETYDPDLQTMGPGWFPTGRGKIVGFAVHADNFNAYLPIRHMGHGGGNLDENVIGRWVKRQLKIKSPKIFANATYDLGWFKREGFNVDPEEVEDVQIQGPLLDENRRSYSLDRLGADYLGERKDEELLNRALRAHGYQDKSGLAFLDPEYVGPYGEQDAGLTRRLWDHFRPMIETQELTQVYNLERKLASVLVDMRMRGVPIDESRVGQLREQWSKEMEAIIAQIKSDTTVAISPWDATSIANALYTQGIRCHKTPQGQPSVTAEWLESLEHPLAKSIGRVRKLSKAIGTFIDGHFIYHLRNGKVHPSFSALKSDSEGPLKGASTGRFSSSLPNFQQIPARDPEIGPALRSCVTAFKGEFFGSADYSSQEPRLTVHFAYLRNFKGAAEAVERYRNDPNTDYHQMVADLCGIPRKQAKPINLGIAYGMGGAKLCRELGLPTAYKTIWDKQEGREVQIEVAGPEGQAILDRVDRNAPFVRKIFFDCKSVAERRGYIRTILGRRGRFRAGWGEERKALNKVIQGSAADQTKSAMVNLYYDHSVIPLLTVHDELCFSFKTKKEGWKAIKVMEDAVPLALPMVIDFKAGRSWGEAVKLPRPKSMGYSYDA